MPTPSPNRLARLKGILAFCIGIFGALAILGVFFKILKLEYYEFFMKVGFMGEAAAFVTMGFFELIGSFATQPATDESEASVKGRSGTKVREMEARIKSEVDALFLALGEDAKRFQMEVRELGAEMELARGTIHRMRSELDQVASGRLAEDAGSLGSGMSELGDEMRSAGSSVQRIRAELEDVAERFSYFNRGRGHSEDRPARASARLKDGPTPLPRRKAVNQ
ncbi:MAG: hypothetical protein HKN13_10455 [Rhodothermales bacterium]|nr:hypothetical protein [Rhodothermales bacterium]